MSFFTTKNISAGYGKDPIIKDISFEIKESSLVGILGANGSGKTTLLKAICGILPHVGVCTLEGCELEKLSSKQIANLISYIPQKSGISIDISALDVVLMGFNPKLHLLEYPNQEMKKIALEALKEVDLIEKAEKNFMHLSEGQKQLCILARTIVASSRLLLLDEPESALDFNYRYRMLSLIKNYTKKNQSSAFVTLHDPSLALNYCDSLILLSDGQIIGEIYPGSDTIDKMEEMLSIIYGKVSLQYAVRKNGCRQLVLLNEEIYENSNKNNLLG